eukprot:TRINITY_DN10138_c0_g1_i1.p1 TRINITY_DN10138_c0_g1~~TRINITY_DN10138_c0_g1_i1.p1  ORF type:complete len:167 (+),score=17.73 TRINITY_DN10138_c0_g1_i1:389-889(+)
MDSQRIGDIVKAVGCAREAASILFLKEMLMPSKCDGLTTKEARPSNSQDASFIIRSLCDDDKDSSASSPRFDAVVRKTNEILAGRRRGGSLESSPIDGRWDDDAASVDSGVSGPPRSRLTSYDLGCDAGDPQLQPLDASLGEPLQKMSYSDRTNAFLCNAVAQRAR